MQEKVGSSGGMRLRDSSYSYTQWEGRPGPARSIKRHDACFSTKQMPFPDCGARFTRPGDGTHGSKRVSPLTFFCFSRPGGEGETTPHVPTASILSKIDLGGRTTTPPMMWDCLGSTAWSRGHPFANCSYVQCTAHITAEPDLRNSGFMRSSPSRAVPIASSHLPLH